MAGPTAPPARRTRRAFLGAGLGGGATLALAACGPAGSPGDARAPSTLAGALTFWHWGSQDYFVRYRTLADEFQKRNPGVTVEVTLVEPGMEQKLLAAITAGDPPNTFVHDFQRAQGWGKLGLVEALDDRAKQSRLVKLGEYSKIALDAITYKGKLQGLPGVGIPGGAAPNLIFYNADHFRREGLPTPHELWKQDRWTWDEFVRVGEKVTKRGGDGKLTQIGVVGYAHRLFMNAAGSKEADDVFAPTKSFYDDPRSIKALQLVQDLRHRFRLEPLGSTMNEIGLNDDQGFMEGRIAMRLRWTTGINVYRPITSFKWGMAPYPKDATYATDYTAAGLALSKGAKLPDASWAWIEWASSVEGQKIDARSTTGVPFNPDAQKVFGDSLKEIANLETPDVPAELINNTKITFLRLLAVDEAKIRAETIDPTINALRANEINGQAAGRTIAQAMNDFLKANPQT
jgi:multiple sugar transport system substrate-binding protein